MKNDFERLIKRLSPTLRKISHRLNGHFTYFNDDDLCQEALVHLWVLFQKGSIADKTDSYILQGCYFHLKNYIRTSMDKASFTSLDSPVDEDGTTLEEIMVSPAAPSSDRAEDQVLSEEIGKFGLDEREFNILRMSSDGMTTREIGEKFGISHVAVIKLKKKIQVKCQKLKKEIKAGYQN